MFSNPHRQPVDLKGNKKYDYLRKAGIGGGARQEEKYFNISKLQEYYRDGPRGCATRE
jgi:hypothetical protein